MWDTPGSQDVAICGCPNGEDFEVLHSVGGEGVIIVSPDGREWPVGWPEWRAAVFDFADRVAGLYAASSPKQPEADDTAGFAKFLMEWERRRGQPLTRA